MGKTTNNFKIIFVHGYTASAKDNWHPGVAKELEKLGIDYAIPDLPGGEHPNAEEWLESIHKVVSKTNKSVVFVGHSLGTRAVLLYLEKYRPKTEAVFLIAAFANRLENAWKYDKDAYPDFFEHIINIEAIKSLVKKFIVMHAKDDPLDYEQGVEIAKDLNAKLITFDERGHFSDAKNAPVIINVLRKELQF